MTYTETFIAGNIMVHLILNVEINAGGSATHLPSRHEGGTEARDPAEHGSTDEVAKRLEIRRLRDEFRDYAEVSLYPLSIGIVTRLLTSIFLPIFFIVFEMWFSSMM